MAQMHGEVGRLTEIMDIRPYMTSVPSLTEHFGKGNGSFEGYVPVSIVERDAHLPFKSERTDELVEDLRQTRERDGWGNGQDSPMLAAYITGEQTPTVEVYDGLHRQVANEVFQTRYGIENDRPPSVFAEIGHAAIHFVTAKPMSRRDMLDKRLTNTRNHPELRFARGGLWSAQLWYLDDISTIAPNLSPKQAFSLAARDHAGQLKDGTALGLDEEAVEKIVQWAKQRAEDWSVDPSTIYKWIHRAESTTPEIIARVRNTGKGRQRSNDFVSEQMVTSLASFMGEEAFKPVHQILIDYSLKNNLTNIQFSNILDFVMNSNTIVDPTDVESVCRALENLDLRTLRNDELARTQLRIRRRTDVYAAGPDAVTSVRDAIARVAESLDVRNQRPDFVPNVDQRKAAMDAAEALEKEAEKAFALAAEVRSGVTNASGSSTNLHPYVIPSSEFDPSKFINVLSEREVTVLQLTADGYSAEEICEELHISDVTRRMALSQSYEKLGARDKTTAIIRAYLSEAITIGGSGKGEMYDDAEVDEDKAKHSKVMKVELTLDSFNAFEARIRELYDPKSTLPTDKEIHQLVSMFTTYDVIRQRAPRLGRMLEAIIFKVRNQRVKTDQK